MAGRLARRPRAAPPARPRAGRTGRGPHGRRVGGEDRRDRRGRLHLGPRADHRPGGARPRASGHRGDAARVVPPPRSRRTARRLEDGAGARVAADAHERRLDARVHPDSRVRRPSDPRGARAGRGARRRVSHGNAEPGDLLRARRRRRGRGARSLRRHLPARGSLRAAAGNCDRARQGGRRRWPAARARAGASVASGIHVRRGAARGAVAGEPRRLRAARPRALPGHQAGQRGDQPTAGATDGAGRSPRGPPGSRRTLGRAGRRGGLRRTAPRLRDHDQHRLQHPGTRSPAGSDGAGRQPAPRPSRRDRPRRRRPNRLRAAAAARRHHDAPHGRRGGRAGGRAAPAARRARLPSSRAALHPVLSCGGLHPGRAALAARRLGRQTGWDPSSVAAPAPGQPVRAVTGSAPRRQRRLALGVLLAAAALAVAVLPIRGTWWGGWILAIAEAGIVGGLADWFAVTAIFRRPLGLPIPHTALIPANWELMAARVGTMVGSRVLTKEYVAQEVAGVDVASLIARAAERLTTRDLDAATRELARWLAAELSPKAAGDLVTRLRDLLLDRPLAPTLAATLELARRHGWDQRLVTGLADAIAEALDRPAFRSTVGGLVDELLARYRERMGTYPRFWLGVASLLGLIDRDRVLGAIQAGLRQVVQDPDHPLRQRLAEAVGELPARLRAEARLAARVEAAKRDLLATPVATRVLEDPAAALHRTLRADPHRPRSRVHVWVAERLRRARPALAGDEELRQQPDQWVKARAIEAGERPHPRPPQVLGKRGGGPPPPEAGGDLLGHPPGD